MDTCAEAVATDALGRRTGPRQRHTIEQKRRIVEETHVRGASVAHFSASGLVAQCKVPAAGVSFKGCKARLAVMVHLCARCHS
jgi:hypothetical protein